MYTIYTIQTINDREYKQRIKSYPFKIQCVVWLYLHGWVYSGIDDWLNNEIHVIACPSCPNAKVEIVKEEDSRV